MTRPRSRGASDDSRAGGGLHAGKRTTTGGALPRTTRGLSAPPSKAPEDKADEALKVARCALADLGEHLPDAAAARSGREFERSRALASTIRWTFARAESEAQTARGAASKVDAASERDRLLVEIDALDADIAAMRPAVDEALRLAPPEAASIPFEAAWEPDVFTSWEDAEAQKEHEWNDVLGAEEAAAWANATPAPLRDDVCAVDGPHSSEALTGTRLYLVTQDEIRGLATATRDYRHVGPGEAGPYRLYGHTKEDQLVYYIAFHKERGQNEWVVGPESVDAFAAAAEMYAGAASGLLPGSAHVEGSQADGADAVRDPDSVVKQEAFGRAPWQRALDGAVDLAADAADPDNWNPGGAFLAARNARIRMNDYVRPARELAEQLAADVAAGKVNHLDARAQAVEGRNALLDKSRERLSPAGRKVSEAIKRRGKTVAEMTEKKVRDNLDEYRGIRKPDLTAETRALLDADSAVWAKYAAAMDAGEDVLRDALRDLGESPAVSRSIIKSAGAPNRWVTRAAKYGGPALKGLGVIGAADAIWDIYNDVEARNWHAAAGEAAGFLGGVLGGEAGVIFLASIVPGAGTGVVIVASIIGSMIGGKLGSTVGRGLVDLIADGGAIGAGGLTTAYGAAGGFAGLHRKDHPAGYPAAKQLADEIFATDAELGKLAKAIPEAQRREDLEALQRKRIEVLARRQQMEDVLTAIKLGAFDGPEECALPEPETEPAPAPSGPLDDCNDLDDDCDREVD